MATPEWKRKNFLCSSTAWREERWRVYVKLGKKKCPGTIPPCFCFPRISPLNFPQKFVSSVLTWSWLWVTYEERDFLVFTFQKPNWKCTNQTGFYKLLDFSEAKAHKAFFVGRTKRTLNNIGSDGSHNHLKSGFCQKKKKKNHLKSGHLLLHHYMVTWIQIVGLTNWFYAS